MHEAAMVLAERDAAYVERNLLVAFLTSCYPSHLMRHPQGEPWDEDWRWIVCVHSDQGQMTWHIHDREQDAFAHLATAENDWDGHGTGEKYDRLRRCMLTRLTDSGRSLLCPRA